MKKNTILSVVYVLALSMSYAQPCKQIVIDSTQKKILFAYINECVREHYFIADKGVIQVKRFIHKSGRPAWSVLAVLDDRYKDNPPTEWTQLNGDIVLFYNADTQLGDPEKTTITPELLKCLDDAIGDRLYIRPPKRDRQVEVLRPGKEPLKIDSRRLWGISGLNQKVIIFEVNGKVTILNSV